MAQQVALVFKSSAGTRAPRAVGPFKNSDEAWEWWEAEERPMYGQDQASVQKLWPPVNTPRCEECGQLPKKNTWHGGHTGICSKREPDRYILRDGERIPEWDPPTDDD